MSESVGVVQQVPAPAGPYSHYYEAGGLLFTSGFGPQIPETGRVPGSIAAQTHQTLRNIERVLESRGIGFGDVIKVTAHLQHLKRDFAEFNSAYREVLTPPYPVRTTVGSELFDILVEIDVVATLGKRL